jgi:hypothetical protein
LFFLFLVSLPFGKLPFLTSSDCIFIILELSDPLTGGISVLSPPFLLCLRVSLLPPLPFLPGFNTSGDGSVCHPCSGTSPSVPIPRASLTVQTFPSGDALIFGGENFASLPILASFL